MFRLRTTSERKELSGCSLCSLRRPVADSGSTNMYSDQINLFKVETVREGFASGMCSPDGLQSWTDILLVDAIMLQEPVDKTQQSWVELMVIMQDCNDRLVSSKDQTRKLVQNETYTEQIDHLRPLFHSWLQRFNALERR